MRVIKLNEYQIEIIKQLLEDELALIEENILKNIKSSQLKYIADYQREIIQEDATRLANDQKNIVLALKELQE